VIQKVPLKKHLKYNCAFCAKTRSLLGVIAPEPCRHMQPQVAGVQWYKNVDLDPALLLFLKI
uniref:Uncharacterized protein n=1 Tax=Cynoglossus semilaevis TaxID=244447 RepID=A0A3P8W1V1_CYNSE